MPYKRMIVRNLPDPSSSTINWDAPCAESRWPSMVTCATTRDVFYPAHEGTLSIKCAFGGEEVYETRHSRFAVDDNSYLILNDRQSYASWVSAERSVESFCVFFQPGFASAGLASLVTPADRLLDNPDHTADSPVEFFERLYPHDAILSPLLFNMRHAIKTGAWEKADVEERLFDVLERLLHVRANVFREVEQLPAVRRATRLELYKRLYAAKDYIDASYSQPLNLGQLAGIACLSTHHFLRLFKSAFRVTPYQYITKRRLEKARRLLKETNLPVQSICFDLGFESPSSFSKLFRRHIGASPEFFRANSAPRNHAAPYALRR